MNTYPIIFHIKLNRLILFYIILINKNNIYDIHVYLRYFGEEKKANSFPYKKRDRLYLKNYTML